MLVRFKLRTFLEASVKEHYIWEFFHTQKVGGGMSIPLWPSAVVLNLWRLAVTWNQVRRWERHTAGAKGKLSHTGLKSKRSQNVSISQNIFPGGHKRGLFIVRKIIARLQLQVS